MSDFGCAAVIPAAGASTRLGQPKQLLRIDGHESLLRRTARLAVEAGCAPVLAVLGYEAEKMAPELTRLPVEIVVNANWREGMGASLRAGMEAVLRIDPLPDSVLVLVCDQPRLTADHLRTLLARHHAAFGTVHSAITASVYAGRAGVPAIFSSDWFSELARSSADRGARDLIQAQAAGVQRIPWPEGELDLDRPEDLAAIER